MSKIKLHLRGYFDDSYKIIIKPGLLKKIPKILKKHNFPKYCIITDDKIKKIYADELSKNLKKLGIKHDILFIPNGEKSKTWEIAGKLGNKMCELDYNRKDCIIAFGGGVVGDLAGFVASIFMRGINFIQIPTTLLAMVDSSIGGKTGVNTVAGKNLLGTFHHPEIVLIDSHFLETLPQKEIQNGLAEVIKYGVISSKSFFKFLERNIEEIYIPRKWSDLTLNHKILNKIIVRSCKIKTEVVEKDEKEDYLRMILNYGHTFGHAIENISKYKINHGQAVAIGMCLANEKAVNIKLLKTKNAIRIKNLINKAKLPTSLPKSIKLADLKKIINKDKKVDGEGKIKFVLLKKIGKPYIYNE